MSPTEFCQWLRGCLDIIETKTLNTKQVEMIKEKLSSIEGHKKQMAKTVPQSEPVYPPYQPIYPTPYHPDLGPEIVFGNKNPNWSGTTQTNQMSLQTFLSPSTAFTHKLYYEHHSDIPHGVAVSGYVGTKPKIETFENTLGKSGFYNADSFTYSNVPIKSHQTGERINTLSMVTASCQMSAGYWSNKNNEPL